MLIQNAPQKKVYGSKYKQFSRVYFVNGISKHKPGPSLNQHRTKKMLATTFCCNIVT